jgi:histone acetyltransferase
MSEEQPPNIFSVPVVSSLPETKIPSPSQERFEVLCNNGDAQTEAGQNQLIYLIQAKTLFATCLPKMPRKYIVRLVLDRNHRVLVLIRDAQVLAGICFRPFPNQGFAEVVFVAVHPNNQVSGIGTRMMNHLKEHVKSLPYDISYFLTYADDHAIVYFKKQGFSRTFNMPKEQYDGFIKHYDHSKLMECRIIKQINYLQVQEILQKQKDCIEERMKKASKSHIVYQGLVFEKDDTVFSRSGKFLPIPYDKIPGLSESGWTPPSTFSCVASHI